MPVAAVGRQIDELLADYAGKKQHLRGLFGDVYSTNQDVSKTGANSPKWYTIVYQASQTEWYGSQYPAQGSTFSGPSPPP